MTIEYKDSKRIVGLSTDTSPDVSFTTNIQNNANGWSETGSQYTITSGQVDYVSKRDGSDHYVNYDLQDSSALSGSNLSETQFVVRWHMKNTGNTTDGYTVTDYLAVRSDDGTSGQSQDYFAFRLQHGNVNSLEPIIGNGVDLENPTTVGSAVSSIVSSTMDNYFEIKRTSATSVTFGIYSDSTYSTLVNEQTLTVSSSYTALRYFSMITRNSTTRGSTMTGVLDTVKIYNAVSSIESKPTDVQDNSILVEKDTARRYWRTPEESGSDTNTSQSTYNDDSGIGSFSGGWGARFNAGHALVGQEIRSIKVRMKIQGSLNTVNMTARLYGSTNSTLRATSTAVSSSGLTTSYVDKTFVFPSGSRGVVQAGDHLLIVADSAVSSQGWNCQIKSGAGTNTHFATWQGQSNAFTEQTNRDLWYDPIVSGTFTPAAWTMEPTKELDFSSTSGWTESDSNDIGVANGKLNWYNNGTNTYENAYYDLGSVSDTKWILRHTLKVSGSPSSDEIPYQFIISNTANANWNTDSACLGVWIYVDRNNAWRRIYTSNKASGTSGGDSGAQASPRYWSDFAYDTTYYITTTRTSATNMTVEIRTGSHSGSIVSNGTLTLTIPSGITGLQYLTANQGAQGTGLSMEVDDVEFYNGVTSV